MQRSPASPESASRHAVRPRRRRQRRARLQRRRRRVGEGRDRQRRPAATRRRHLVTILLHLLTAESLGLAPWTAAIARRSPSPRAATPPIAAATLAAAVGWPLRVFVPTACRPVGAGRGSRRWAPRSSCARGRDDDPPGDPCMHRFREAVAAGAIRSACRAPENAWCLDGGRTIGWEMARIDETSSVRRSTGCSCRSARAPSPRAPIGGFRMSGVMPRLARRADARVARRCSGRGGKAAGARRAGGGRGALESSDVAVGARRQLGRRRHPRRRDLRLDPSGAGDGRRQWIADRGDGGTGSDAQRARAGDHRASTRRTPARPALPA